MHRISKLLVLGAIVVAVVAFAWLAFDGWRTPRFDDGTTRPDEPVVTESTAHRTTPAQSGSTRRDAMEPTGPWSAPRGSRFVYRVRSSTDFRLEEGDAPGQPTPAEQASAMRWTAQIEWVVVDRDDQAILTSLRAIRFALDGVDPDDPDVRALTQAMQSITFLRLRRDGEAVGMRVDPSVPIDARDFLRNLVSMLAYRVGASDGSYRGDASFETEESDNTGRFLARYRRLSPRPNARFERKKLRYVRMPQTFETVPEHEIDGQVRLTFDAERWLRDAEIEDRIGMQLPGFGSRVEVVTTARVERTTVGRVELLGLRAMSSMPEDEFEPTGGEHAAGTMSPEDRLAELRAQIGDRSIGELLDALRAALAAHGPESREVYDAWLTLGHLLEIRPEAAADVARMLRTLGDDPVADQLASALGAAGTEAAQDQLIDIAADAAVPENIRGQAVISTHQVAKPKIELIESLSRQVEGGHGTGLGEASVLALGTLSTRNRDPQRDGRTALEVLLAQESKAGREGWLATWLEALGNTADAAVLPTVLRYAEHALAGLRATAARVLARIPDPRVTPALIDRIAVEREVGVRRAIADALGDCPAGPADAALRRLAEDPDRDTCFVAIPHLGRRLQDADNLALLQRLSRSSADRELRELASDLLASWRQR